MYGVVPVENSSEGVVNHTLDGFLSSDLKIIGEVELPVSSPILGGRTYQSRGDFKNLCPSSKPWRSAVSG